MYMLDDIPVALSRAYSPAPSSLGCVEMCAMPSVLTCLLRQLMVMLQDKEKAKLEENRVKVIDRTRAIIEQAEKMRNAPVGTGKTLIS